MVYLPRELVALLHTEESSLVLTDQGRAGNGNRTRPAPSLKDLLAKETAAAAAQKDTVEATAIWKMSPEDRKQFIKARKDQNEVKEDNDLISMKLNYVDVKTGLVYKTLEKKIKDFERTLQNPNVDLIQGIVSDDPSILLRGDHVIIKGDPEKTKAKIYMALIGLQSFRKRTKGNRKLFKDYLSIIAPKLESDITKIEELLMFFITGKRKIYHRIRLLTNLI